MDYRSDYIKRGQSYTDSVHRFFSTQDRPDLPLSPGDAAVGTGLSVQKLLELEELREQMATRVGGPPHCEHCDTVPYGMGLPEEAEPNGWLEMNHQAGWVKQCLACRHEAPVSYEWIRRIPLESFHQFMEDHPWAFCLDELRPLVPPSRPMVMAKIMQPQAPKGGFEFL